MTKLYSDMTQEEKIHAEQLLEINREKREKLERISDQIYAEEKFYNPDPENYDEFGNVEDNTFNI